MYGILLVATALLLSPCFGDSVNFSAVSYPPCVAAFTIGRMAQMYGIPDSRFVLVASAGCNVTFTIVDADGSQNNQFISAAALNYYLSTLELWALQNITMVESLSFTGPTPAPPPPLPSSIPTPVPVTSPTFVATFDSTVHCASFSGSLASFLQILPSRILFSTSPDIACPSQSILQFSFAKRINGDVVTVADISFALNAILQSADVVQNVLGATSITCSGGVASLPSSSLFAVGNVSAAVFTVASSNFNAIADFMRNAYSSSSFALLWLTDNNETSFTCSDDSFLSCVYPGWTQAPTQSSNGKHFPLFWICCGLTLFGFAVTCVIVSKRPRDSVVLPQGDLTESLKRDSPLRENDSGPAADRKDLLPKVILPQDHKSEFDME